MGEERLKEIALKVVENGPLWEMGYVSSLSDSEKYLLRKYVKSSKYSDMDFCDALFAFSNDYLRSKNISTNEDTESYEQALLGNQNNNEISYFGQLFAVDEDVKAGRHR